MAEGQRNEKDEWTTRRTGGKWGPGGGQTSQQAYAVDMASRGLIASKGLRCRANAEHGGTLRAVPASPRRKKKGKSCALESHESLRIVGRTVRSPTNHSTRKRPHQPIRCSTYAVWQREMICRTCTSPISSEVLASRHPRPTPTRDSPPQKIELPHAMADGHTGAPSRPMTPPPASLPPTHPPTQPIQHPCSCVVVAPPEVLIHTLHRRVHLPVWDAAAGEAAPRHAQ